MRCKANCAAHVRINTPQPVSVEGTRLLMLSIVGIDRYNMRFLDTSRMCGIISITIGMPILRDCGAREERQQASEDSYPPRGGYVEPGTREGSRSEISRQRVLRPTRHCAGQVRDAAPRVSRECVGDQRNRGIRGFEADLLSDQSQLRRIGNRRAGAEEAGSTRPSQAPGRSSGIYPRTTGCQRGHSSARTDEADPPEIRPRCTPEDDRASRRKKNSEMTSSPGDGPEGSTSIVAQYETLRRAALGHALPPEARGGLMLFLCRGMWGWARAMAMTGASMSQQPSCSALNCAPSADSTTLIHIFAAMAMSATHRGATR
jgi:hypothetical protein